MKSQYHLDVGFQYPRSKKYMKSLNVLLSNKPLFTPEDLIRQKLFSQRSSSSYSLKNKINYQILSRNKLSYQNTQVKQKVLQKIKKSKQQSLQEKKSKMIARIKSSDARLNSSPLQITTKYYSVKLQKPNKNPQIKNNYYTEGIKVNRQKLKSIPKPFLRKGSSINRQIVVNLLKMKINRQSKKIEKEIKNDQIINMVKTFKGAINKFQFKENQHDKMKNKRGQSIFGISAWDNDIGGFQEL